MVFYSFYLGVNYNNQIGGNTYFYEIGGYLLVLLLCVIERKSQIWLSNKFGFEGSAYDNYEGRIKLEQYVTDIELDASQKSKYCKMTFM
jgi:hypothetical protein